MKLKLLVLFFALCGVCFAQSYSSTISLGMIQCGNPTISSSNVQAFFYPVVTITNGTTSSTITGSATQVTWPISDATISVSVTTVGGATAWVYPYALAQGTLAVAQAKYITQTTATTSSNSGP